MNVSAVLTKSGERQGDPDALALFWGLFRDGRFDEARRLCGESLCGPNAGEAEGRVRWTCAWAMAEREIGNLWVSLCCHATARCALGQVSPKTRANWHIGFAVTCKRLAEDGAGGHYFEEALDSLALAKLESGDDPESLAVIANNTASCLHAMGRAGEALELLAEARSEFERGCEPWRAGEIEDTLARVLLALGRRAEAHAAIGRAVATLRGAGERRALLRALDTQEAVTASMREELDGP